MSKESRRQTIKKLVYNKMFTSLFTETENRALYDLITKAFRCNVITYQWYKVMN